MKNSVIYLKYRGEGDFMEAYKLRHAQVATSFFADALKGFEAEISLDVLTREVEKNLHESISTQDIEMLYIMAATSFIERDPAYSKLAATLLCSKIFKEVTGNELVQATLVQDYQNSFKAAIIRGVEGMVYDARLASFDIEKLAQALRPERDQLFEFLGIQTLYERYLCKLHDRSIIELPQVFWMRVAMGLAFDEQDKEKYALEFYEQLSTMRSISSTPTLFHSGTMHPQLSSCYLTTIPDELNGIFKCMNDNAHLAKWSGGIGNDWSYLRATGSQIKSIKATSNGVIPYLKIANDVTSAINRSGNRRGATVAYLETWHYDIEDFLDLRRNTGDERRRTHDMNTANWIPDLFMKRVLADGEWTLFSPDEVIELHDLYGAAFEAKYAYYEQAAKEGKIKLHKTISAKQLWKKMLTRLFETGHPWVTFKDVCNIRSPQDHVGVVHSSNLCTEITLNTSPTETAVCNLTSINLEKHVKDGQIDFDLLAMSVKTAIRMLDNVIDINFYPTIEAKNSNKKHRPVGLGIMGFQDLLIKLDLGFESAQTIELTDKLMEFISYHAILASADLAQEKGAYETFKGSKWDRGIFPIDTLDLLEKERGMEIKISRSSALDWTPVREKVKAFGMRNSNTMAIAPTATISNIAGCYPCIEPLFKNVYVKANISGEFTIVNNYLVADLKKLGLWGKDMLDQIKYYDGSVQKISSIPEAIRAKYKEAFEIAPEVLVELTARRSKWIDQSQSNNVFLQGTSGQKLSDIYFAGWQNGMKTFYYLRTLAATQIEKSTLDAGKFGFTQKRSYGELENVSASGSKEELTQGKTCSMSEQACDSCQ